MSSKLTYLFMRGVIRFFVILRSNFLSFLTLTTVIFMYHVFWVAGSGTAGFLNHLSQANTIRVYLANNNDIIAEQILSSIKVLDNVTSAKYYSQKDAKAFAVANAPKAGHIKGVDEVSYGKEYMIKFKAIGRGAWLFITAMSVLFALSAVFVVYNTIKLSLYKYKEEIKLYSLVGATRPFISYAA